MCCTGFSRARPLRHFPESPTLSSSKIEQPQPQLKVPSSTQQRMTSDDEIQRFYAKKKKGFKYLFDFWENLLLTIAAPVS
uniref:Uncharacterized protein n=1 Tax=Anguilla anguilla TaxID=7936 RepID=A0A0E9QDX4_ANGAN